MKLPYILLKFFIIQVVLSGERDPMMKLLNAFVH